MVKKRKVLTYALCALLCACCALFGVSVTLGEDNRASAESYTEVSVSGSAVSLSNSAALSDRIRLSIDGSDWNKATDTKPIQDSQYANGLGTFSGITVVGTTITNTSYSDLDVYFNLWGSDPAAMTINITGATQISFPKGTKFPSYDYATNGTGDVYVLSQTVNFTRTSTSSNDWTREVVIEKTYVDLTMSHASDYDNYKNWYNISAINISLGGKNTLPKDGGAGYFVNDHATQNGVDLAEYIYINGVSVRSVLAENATSGKYKHSDVFPLTVGGVYAPISVWIDSNQIQLKIMGEYAGTGSFSLTVKAGFVWENTDGEYLAIKDDVKYSYDNGNFTREYKVTDVTDSVVMTDLGWNAAKDYTLITLSLGGYDVLPVSGTGAHYANDHPTVNGTDILSYLEVNEKNVRETVSANTSYVGTEYPMDIGGLFAPVLVQVQKETFGQAIVIRILESYAEEKNFYLTLKAGFTWVNVDGLKLTVSSDITYGYVDGTFQKTEIDRSVDVTDSLTVTENKDYRSVYNVSYLTLSLGGKNTLPKDGGAAYYVNDNAAKNGVDLAEYIYINGASVRSALAENATSGKYKHSSGDMAPMNNGGIYAPVAVYVDANQIVIRIMCEYVQAGTFSLTIKPFSWENSDGEILTVKTEKNYVFAGDNITDADTVTVYNLNGAVYMEESAYDGWNANGSYKLVKLEFVGVNFSAAMRSGSAFCPTDNENYTYLQDFVFINGESVKAINAKGGFAAPDEFPASIGGVYAVPVQLCVTTDGSGIEESGLYLRIQKEYYATLTQLRVSVGAGFNFYDDGTVYRLTEKSETVFFGEEVKVTVKNAGGETLQVLTCYKNSRIILPDVSTGNCVLLGWLIDGNLYSPAKAYEVGDSDCTVTAVTVDFSMITGASVYASGRSGIRFTYRFGADDWNAYGGYIAESGIMLLPADTLDGTDFVMGNFVDGETVIVGRNGVSKQVFNAETGDYEYMLRLTGIFEKNYARAFAARAYLSVNYADGTSGYVYTRFSLTDNSRSVMQISKLCKDGGNYESLSASEKEIIDNYITVGENNLPKDYVISVIELSAQAIKDAYSAALKLTGEQLAGFADIVVSLPKGTLELDETLSFPSETRVNERTIRFVGDETVISGGKSFVGGWTEYANGVYSKNVGTQYSAVRQLYANGVPATLARTSNVTGTWDAVNRRMIIPASALEGVTVDGKMEVSTLERWAQSYGIISSVTKNGDNYEFAFTSESEYVYFDVVRGYANENTIMFLQNSLNFLDEANEFYYDSASGTLYYKPADGTDVNSLTFTLPVAETLLTTENMVDGITFENVEFAYSAFNQPSVYGYLEQQANVYSSYQAGHGWTVLSKAITVVSDNVTFSKCTVRGTGAGGIGVERGASNVLLDGNTFIYIAGTAVFVGDNVDSDENLPNNISIVGNVVDYYGTVFGGAAGITVTYAKTADISYNTVQNGFYSGISLGWGWTANANAQHGDYTVTHNRIINPMRGDLYDGGGIYLLGNFAAEAHNVVSDNYIEIYGTCLAAIYLDEGASDYTVTNNAMKVEKSNTEKGCVFLHNNVNETTGLGIENVTVSGNYSNLTTCGYKYVRNGQGELFGSTYNKNHSVSYENAIGSSAEHVNENIYAKSGATAR